VQLVVRDIMEAQKQFSGPGNWLKRNFIGFLDNNLGGNPKFLKELCSQLKSLNIKWACAITFNVLSTPGIIKMMSDAGCVAVFVGLESFNPKTIADMNKNHNRLEHVNRVIHECLSNGILLTSGMMISPSVDDIDYMQQLPRVLAESGLCIPEFLSFEVPFPGTPKFERLSRQQGPTFLPNTFMYDYDANTLVTVPKYHNPQDYVAAYRQLRRTLPSVGNVILKLRSQMPPLVMSHAWLAIGAVLYEIGRLNWNWKDHPERTYIGGTDIVPPEVISVPFAADDFESEFERDNILTPWKITDDQGHVLDKWLHHHQPYSR
jgi:hypothetical protein